MRGFWKCQVCQADNSVLADECANLEEHELLRCDRIIAGARYAALHNIKRPHPEVADNWKDFAPEDVKCRK